MIQMILRLMGFPRETAAEKRIRQRYENKYK